ncbi:MAG: hypothetical protein H6924_02975 [Alphaproteobacteria bacterium]|nr:hypothetical protein [Alphaproteobacteria bacterium]
MTKQFARPVVRLAVVLALAMGTTACETVSDTVSDLDPTGLFGGDDTAPLPADDANAPPTASTDANVNTPDLAALPPRPAAPDAAAQTQAAQQVAAAGTQAQYSADALRAGTEAAAPPPLAPGSVPPSAAAPTAQAAMDAPPTAEAPPSAAPPSAAPPTANPVMASNAPPTAEAPPAAAPPSAEPPVAAPAPAPAPVRSASVTPPPGAEPAVPAVPPAGSSGAMMAAANPSDAALGFKRSSAPALDPSISKWVAGPILAHYRQTAAQAGTAGQASGDDSGSNGSVIANLNAAPGTPAGMAAAMNGGVPPNEIIYFAGDGTSLSAKARKQVSDAVAAFKANGGTGSIKVVGHASSRTGNMSIERHMELIFRSRSSAPMRWPRPLSRPAFRQPRSRSRRWATASRSITESMLRGEEGNRRAEIYPG